MGKKIYYIALSLLLAFAAGCDNGETGADPNALVLEASASEVVLDRNLSSETAITFSWNKGIDRGADYTVSYYFRLHVFGTEFDNSTDPVIIPADGEREVSFTHQELYELMTNKWGIALGARQTLEGRLVAKVDGPTFKYPEISYAAVDVENYRSEPLFIMGDATIAGNDPSKAIPMTEKEVGLLYYWQGSLKQGGFKIIVDLNEELPSLNRGADNNTFVQRTQASEPDDLFTIDADGMYSVVVYRSEMRIEYVPMPYSSVFLIGNATSAEWSINNAIELKAEPTRPNEFKVITELKEGELKFYSARDWNSTFFKPEISDASIKDNEVVIAETGGDDRKWKVKAEEAGKYRITLNTLDLKIKFEKVE